MVWRKTKKSTTCGSLDSVPTHNCSTAAGSLSIARASYECDSFVLRIAAKADWQFTTADARVKLKRLYPSL